MTISVLTQSTTYNLGILTDETYNCNIGFIDPFYELEDGYRIQIPAIQITDFSKDQSFILPRSRDLTSLPVESLKIHVILQYGNLKHEYTEIYSGFSDEACVKLVTADWGKYLPND